MTDLGEFGDEVMIVSDEFLHRFVVAEIAEIAEDRHKSFGFEREAVDFEFDGGVCGESDVFAFDLVGKKGCDDGEDSRDNVVVSDYMIANRGYSEELEGKILDRGFGLPVNQEIGIDDSMIYI